MSFQRNHLLAALPQRDLEAIGTAFKAGLPVIGEALYESGAVLHHVYFPVDAIVSLLSVMLDGSSAEIAVVGNDGVVGISLFMGGESTPSRGVVQSAGQAYRLHGTRLKPEFSKGKALQHLPLRYTQSLLTQMGSDGSVQSASCA